MPPRRPSKIRSRVSDQKNQLKNNRCNIRTTWIRTHRLFIVLKDFPGLFQVTSFFHALSLQVAFQQLLKHTSVGAFVSQNAAGCLTRQEHCSWGRSRGYGGMRKKRQIDKTKIVQLHKKNSDQHKGETHDTSRVQLRVEKQQKEERKGKHFHSKRSDILKHTASHHSKVQPSVCTWTPSISCMFAQRKVCHVLMCGVTVCVCV